MKVYTLFAILMLAVLATSEETKEKLPPGTFELVLEKREDEKLLWENHYKREPDNNLGHFYTAPRNKTITRAKCVGSKHDASEGEVWLFVPIDTKIPGCDPYMFFYIATAEVYNFDFHCSVYGVDYTKGVCR